MGKESSHSRMESSTKASECSNGQMVENTLENGVMVNNTAKVLLSTNREKNEKEFGKTEKESTGFLKTNNFFMCGMAFNKK